MTKEVSNGVDLLNMIIPFITFVLGFLVSRFTMSKAERKTDQREQQKFSDKLLERRNDRHESYVAVLERCLAEEEEHVRLDVFGELARKGEAYLAAHTAIADSILSTSLPKQAIMKTHAPAIVELVNRTMPKFFDTLRGLAEKLGLQYNGTPDRTQYQSIFEVYDEYKDKV